MARFPIFIAFIVFLGIVSAEESSAVDDSARGYYKPKPKVFKCPCKCFVDYEVFLATKQCHKKKFLVKCAVLPCKKKLYYGKEKEGKWCCDKPPSPSPSPIPSRTPTPSPKPKCPCKCVKKKKAIKQCYHLPYCKVLLCKKKPHYGYYYKPKYECCDPPKY